MYDAPPTPTHPHPCTHTHVFKDAPSSVPSSPPAAALSSPTTNRGRRSSARRRYNTESNRVVFNGIRLLGQMDVVQAGKRGEGGRGEVNNVIEYSSADNPM